MRVIWSLLLPALLAAPPWRARVEGAQAASHFGAAVAGGGDADADGYADALIGAPDHDGPARDGGAAMLYLGSAVGLTTAAVVRLGDGAGDRLGAAVAWAGDVDGDGDDDALLAAPEAAGGGAVWLLAGDPVSPGAATPWSLAGEERRERLGAAVAGLGDVDGDGYADVAIGAPRHGADDRGRVLVFFGGPTGLSRRADQQIEGAPGDQLGDRLAPAGDVDGDGHADLLVRAAGGQGAVWLLRGGPDGLETAPSTVWVGADDAFGEGLAGAGDVDGDGYDDVLIGAPRRAVFFSGEGRASLYRGGPGGPSTAPDRTWEGEFAMGRLGTSLALVDLGSDGLDDVVIGSARADAGDSQEGLVVAWAGDAADPGAVAVASWQPDYGGARLGTALAGGDVDGDGREDLLAGAPSEDTANDVPGAVWLVTDPERRAPRPVWLGRQSHDGFGAAVAVGDVDGDGQPEIAVGSSTWDGAAILQGRVDLLGWTDLGPAPAAARAWEGQGERDALGLAVALGDLNGDGRADLAIAAREPSGGRGRVELYLSGPAGLSAAPDAVWRADEPDEAFGTALCAPGDLDGDGIGDLAVGAPDASEASSRAGRVYLFFGQAGAPAARAGLVLDGDLSGGQLGAALAAPGDLDGDGFADLFVGAPGSIVPGAAHDAGAVLVVYGGARGRPRAQRIDASSRGGRLGTAVAAGDVDGDGASDLIAGLPRHSRALFIEGGLQVHLARAGGLAPQPALRIEGGRYGLQLGSALAALGDVDGDGYGDVAAGLSPSPIAREVDLPRVRVYRGGAAGLVDPPWWTADWGVTGDHVYAAGDLNRDGHADLLVHSADAHGAEPREGLYVWLGHAGGLTVAGEDCPGAPPELARPTPSTQPPGRVTLGVQAAADPEGDDAHVDVRLSGAAGIVEQATVAGGAPASWTPGAALAEGTYGWSARLRDRCGRTAGWSDEVELRVEAPAVDTDGPAGETDGPVGETDAPVGETDAPAVDADPPDAPKARGCGCDGGAPSAPWALLAWRRRAARRP